MRARREAFRKATGKAAPPHDAAPGAAGAVSSSFQSSFAPATASGLACGTASAVWVTSSPQVVGSSATTTSSGTSLMTGAAASMAACSFSASSGSRKKNRSGITSQRSCVILPRRRSTSRASIHHIRPIECVDLVLHGMAMSTNLTGESVLQNAMTGMLTYDASVTGWWSVSGSVTISRRGSRNVVWIWLVKAPGVKRPAIGVACV
uniref:Uncharacterized protein n=1 Tax=Anopheles merus TaxID=30066 RepID=A0A182VHF1_ANOME